MNEREMLKEKGISYGDILEAYGDPRMNKPLLTACFNGTVGFPPKLHRLVLRLLGISARDFITKDGLDDHRAVITPDYELLNMIGVDKRNAIGRYELTEGLYPGKGNSRSYDRKMRQRIERMRRDYIIINDQDGGGYYISNDLTEIERYYNQEHARAMKILFRLKKPRKILREAKII